MTVTDIAAALSVQMQRAAVPPLPSPATRRALREAAGLTTDQLAQVLHVTRQTVCNWELGRREPRGEQRAAYLEALRFLREAV
jgi:DNA-binding transcriptional regulator YiaG